MNKHTPGPWSIKGPCIDLKTGKNERDVSLLGAEKDDGWCTVIGRIYYSDPSGVNEEAFKANARLIAAAPELLDALKEIAKDQYGSSGARARAAIAKAEPKEVQVKS